MEYVDFGTIQFCFEDQQFHILSMLPSEWRVSHHLDSGLLCRENSFRLQSLPVQMEYVRYVSPTDIRTSTAK
jgi:hypothetical protein